MNAFTFVAPMYDLLFSGVQKRQGKELLERLSPLQGKKVLDLGGGTGRFAEQMALNGADVSLLDASPQMLKRAQRVLPRGRICLGDSADLPYPDDAFDVITLVDVFHHIRKQKQTLSECYRVLRPGGCLCFLEFNPECTSIKILAGIERVLGEPSLFVTVGQLGGLLEQAGFTHINTEFLLADEYITCAKKPLS